MYFSKLLLNNYGLYKGKHVIDFPVCNTDSNITLIGGLNGRGKTTLLEAISLVLYGQRAIKYLSDERISYHEYLSNHINKSAGDQEASITLTLILDETTKESLTVHRTWQKNKQNLETDFWVKKDEQIDKYLSDSWDYYIEEILPLGISRFFFFDNEKIAQIADDDSFESVKDAIKVLLGLTNIDQLVDDMNKILKQHEDDQARNLESESIEELSQINEASSKTESELEKCATQLGSLQRKIGHAQKQYDDLENEFWTHGGQLGMKREEMNAEKVRLNQLMTLKKEQIMDYISRSTTPLLLCIPLLTKTFDQLQQDEVAKSIQLSQTIIDKLKELLISFEQEPSRREVILNFLLHAQDTFTQSNKKIINMNFTPTAQEILKNMITQAEAMFAEISTLLNEIQTLDTQLIQLELRLNFNAESNDAKTIWENMKKLTEQITRIESEINSEEEKRKQLEYQKESLEERRKKILRSKQQIEQEQDEAVRLINYAEMTKEVMEAFKIKLQQQRSQELEKQIYECFTFIAQKQSLIQSIRIDSNTLDIQLVDYKGNELLKSQLSAGEKQIFAISILWGLAKCSGYQMPVIVDTPLGRLDSYHRTNFVSRYLPHAGQQVIVLSTDEEINGRYYDLIKPHINGVFLLDYDEQEKSTFIRSGYFGGQTV